MNNIVNIILKRRQAFLRSAHRQGSCRSPLSAQYSLTAETVRLLLLQLLLASHLFAARWEGLSGLLAAWGLIPGPSFFYLSKINKQLFSSSSIICPYPSLAEHSQPLFFSKTAGRCRCHRCVSLWNFPPLQVSLPAGVFLSTPGCQADLFMTAASLRFGVWQVLLLWIQFRLSR